MASANPQGDFSACIDDCLTCYRVCKQMAMTTCLEMGGPHVEPEHFRLMTECAEICRTAADFLLSGSGKYREVCAVCADLCEACAQSCQLFPDLRDCVAACRRCAASCHAMSGRVGSARTAWQEALRTHV